MYSRDELADHFRRLGVKAGDVIMLHASVRAVGPLAGGPDLIHLALRDALTDSGTLMMYAGCPRYFDEVGRGNLTSGEEAEILAKLPAFDPCTARSARDHGILAEFFRTWPGTRVNPHVARFAVSGRDAELLISRQPWDYAYGRDSALERFAEKNGRILLLGSDHDAVTFLHYAEHIVDIPNKRVVRYQVPVLEHGVRVWKPMAEFDTSEGVHASWPDTFFAEIVDGFLRQTGNDGGNVGHAQSYLISAPELLNWALDKMRQQAA